MKIVYLIPLLFLVSCSDARRSKILGFGQPRSIECYSGEKLIYSGYSTGKINSEDGSDGYYFQEKRSGKLIEVSGNCILGEK